MTQNMTTIKGSVLRITFQNPDNGYTVAKVTCDNQVEPVVAVGIMPSLDEGQEVEIKGKSINHPKFGPQVEVESFTVSLPKDQKGIERYLASGLVKGVGPKLAQRIVDNLGANAIETIINDEEKLAKVPGIGKRKAKSITEAVAGHGQLRKAMVFLQGHGVPPKTALRIFKQYKNQTMEIMQNHPHRLAEDVRGIGFATADKIAIRLGITNDDPMRLQAGLLYTLSQAADKGHMYLSYEELMEQAVLILQVERKLLGPIFVNLHSAMKIVVDEDQESKRVYLSGLYQLEQKAARNLARQAKAPGLLPKQRAQKAVEWVASQLSVQPSQGQMNALLTLMNSGLAVLTGGPGTGKTTLVRALLTIAQRMDLTIALAAPTGRAAKKLAESTGQEAMTLHRLLEFSPKDSRFLRNSNRPIEADLLVVDECSMIDIWLMAHLSDAISPDCKLILVGDADQLPSVGPGLVLRQIIESEIVQVAKIKEIFRQDQAGLIVRNAHRILHGKIPILPNYGEKSDFYFIEEDNPQKSLELTRRMVCERLKKSFGFDPVEDVQVLCPMHKGNMGCTKVNQVLRSYLNPLSKEDKIFAKGDKVMQLRNNYDLEVFNGDMGQVLEVNDESCLVMMGDREIVYENQDLDDLTLAYAITIHKSQGSEYPAVVILLGMEHFIMLNRPLLYTAVTRGKNIVVVVGNKKALSLAIKKNEPVKRNACLDKALIRQYALN